MIKVKLSQMILDNYRSAFKSLMAGLFVFANMFLANDVKGQITQVGTATTSNVGTNTVTINKPTGVQVNDFLIATIAYNEESGNIDLNVAPTAPTGWVLIQDVNLDNSNGDDEWRGAVFYKIAVASDVAATNYLFTLDVDADGVVGGIVAFRNVNTVTPFDVANGTINVTNSATITANSKTTVNPNSAIIMLAMVSDNNTISGWTTTSPGALTELFDAGTSTAGQNEVGAAWAIKATAGATGNGTATMGSTDENGGILLALRACVPPAVTPIGGGASTVCVGANTPAFTDATLGGVWSIINGTGSATIAGTGIATGVSAGTVTVVYTVTDVSGCSASATTSLTVITVPTVTVISGSSFICPGSTGNAYSVTNVPGVTYTWTLSGSGWSITSGQGTNSITLSADATFPHTLTVTPSNTCGNGSQQNLIINEVTPGVIAKGASNPGPACPPLNPGATVNSNSGTGTAYRWEQSTDGINWSNATGTITNSTYDPPSISTTTYYRRVRTNGGTCELASNVLIYTVYAPPVVPPIGGGATTVCVGGNTPAFTNSASGGVWSTSNTGIATILPSGVAHGVTAGNVNIIYTITDINGCSASSTAALIVQSGAPAQPSTITGAATVCTNEVSSSYSVSNVAGVTYTWTIVPGGSGWSIASGQGTNTVTLNTGSVFPQTLTVTPSNACGTGTARTLTITSSEDPVFCTSCTTCSVTPGNNPTLTGTCPQLKVALVIDESSSIALSGSVQEVENGVMSFVAALSCVGVEMSVIEFSDHANFVLNGYQVINDNIVTAMQNYFDNVNNALLVGNADYTPPPSTPYAYTNYQAALLAVDALTPTPDLILFFTDGVPTRVYLTNPPPAYSSNGSGCGDDNSPQAAEIGNPALVANKLKCEGAHMFVYGVGDAESEVATIQAISGPDEYVNGVNTISTADYATSSFEGLEEGLASFVAQLCPFSSEVYTQNVCPSGSNGSFLLTVPSEVFPYAYEYFNDVTNQSLGSGSNINSSPLVISGLAVGSYRLEVDITLPGSGCTRTETFFFDIIAGAVEVAASVTSTTQPTCLDLNAGSATLTITAGQAPFIITLKKGGFTEGGYPIVQNGLTYTATGLDFGSYTFELLDANLCNTDIDAFTLNEPSNCCSATCPADITVECGSSTAPAATGSPTNTTGCGTITSSDNSSPGVCPVMEIITRTWSGSLSGVICVQTITVVDHTAPVITGTLTPLEIEGCIATSAPGAATTLEALEALPGNIQITDGCSPDSGLTLSSSQTESGTCPILITRTYYVTDPCNNTSVAIVHLITVDDTTTPVISTCAGTINLEGCGTGAISTPGFSTITATSSEAEFENGTNMGVASDACDITSVQYIDVANGTCPIVVTRKWTISDACGNSSTCTQTINVDDSTPPVIDCPIVATPVECPATPLFGSATATDICDASVDITFADVTTPGGICPQEYSVTRTWTATDDCGNTATCSRTIFVEDNTAPILTCPNVVSPISCPDTPVFGTATATDACDADVSVTFSDVTTPSGVCPQEFSVTRTWTATDDCGNTSTCSRTIIVEDNTAPVITCPVVLSPINCPATPSFGTATATDDCDPSVAISFSDVTTPGACTQAYTVTRTWIATDDCGNSSSCSRSIVVQDNIPPVLTCPNVTSPINCPSVPVFGAATATDACDAVVAITFSTVIINGPCPGTSSRIRTWTATDDCGNTSTCSRTIVVQDITPPVITCPNVVSPINCPATPSFGTATATDGCDASVAVTFSDVTTPGACTQAYSVTRTWVATDDCGNSSTCSKTIVVQDITPPVITCPNEVSPLNCPATPAFGTATATDGCDADVAVTFSDVTTPGACTQAYSVTRTWVATDDCGNTSTCSKTIVVQDITPPVLTCPNVTTPISCPAVPIFGAATAIDACDATVAITFSTININGPCPGTFSRVRTWTATDDCGNTSTCSRTIVVQDISPPVITCPADITVVYPASTLPANTGSATATDVCDSSPALSYSDSSPSDICASENRITRTWIATDACGNSSTCVQTILNDDRGSVCGSVHNNLGQPLSGIEIRLEADVNGNGVFDGGDTLVAVVFSDAGTGNFCFLQLRPCKYVLVEIQPATYSDFSDYDLTPDPDGDDSGDGPDNQIPVTLSPSEADADNNFIDITCPTILPVIPPDTICANGTVVFQIPDLGPGLTYSWNFGSGATPQTGLGLGPISVNYVTTTNNQANGAVVTMTISKAGCPDLTGEVSHVEINPYPNAAISGSTANLCYFTNRTFQPVAAQIPGATYQWTFDSGAVPLTATGYGPQTVYYTTTGSKTVKLVIHPNEPGAQCPDSSSISFVVTPCVASIFGNVRSVSGVGIGSVTLNLYKDANVDGIADDTIIVKSATTVSTGPAVGNYSMTSIIPGNYVLIEVQPLNWLTFNDRDITEDGDLFPNIDTLDNLIPVTLGPSESDGGNNFKESPAPGSITGYVFNDINADTLPDILEGLQDVTISLFHDSDTNGIADSPVPITTQITDATGFYAFTNVPIGIYVIAETQPLQYVSIKDYDFIEDLDLENNTDEHNDTIPVTIINGEFDDGNYFAEQESFLEIFCPVDTTISCQVSTDPINTGFATTTDNCEGVVITYSETTTQNADENLCSHYTYEIIRTWEATDDCGDYATCIQTIQVQDLIAPVFTFCPPSSMIDCPQIPVFGIPIVSDACDPDPVVILGSTITLPGGGCPQEYSMQRTWFAIDACGNSSSCTQTIQVRDLIPPSITCPPNILLNCTENTLPPNTGYATATDFCSSSPVIEWSDEVLAGNCPAEYGVTRRWIATDECLNRDTCYQLILVQDTTGPIWLTPVGGLDTTLECSDAAGLAYALSLIPEPDDVCSGGVVIFPEPGMFIPGACPQSGTITNRWYAKDACNLQSPAAFYQVITIIDTTAPVWLNEVGELDTILECGDVTGLALAQALFPQASDNCDNNVSNIIETSGTFVQDLTCPQAGTYTNTWIVTDECGNTSSAYTQTITIVDTMPPVWITMAGVLDRTLECSDAAGIAAAEALFPVASDICDNNVVDIVKVAGPLEGGICPLPSTYTNTWTATDDCGNTSTIYIQTITLHDTSPPSVNCPVNLTINCEEDNSSTNTGVASATDNCSGVTITQSETSSQNSGPGSCSYTITRTWKATDACGNTSTCNQLITVQDNTPPLITCPADVVRNCQDDLSPSGTGSATSTDNCDSSPVITSTDVSTQNSDQEVCGHYSYTISRTWTAIDACGNSSTCNQVITVQDITAPLITCPVNVTKNCQDDLSPSGTGSATATDNCDSSPAITSTDVSTQNSDSEVCGHYTYIITRTWKATDACGNTSTCDQVITVQDVTSPLITCPANVAKNCQDDLSPSGTGSATSTDNCDSSPVITSTDVSTQDSDPDVCGHYSYTITRTWKATDACGNSSTCDQVIMVHDVTAPLITCPANVTKNCQDDLSSSGTGSATALDNCDSSPAITSTEVSTQNADPEVCGHYSYIITRTWKATDACGNMSTCDQIITVQDNTPPLITCPADVVRNCQDDLSPTGTGSATATDNCSGVSISQSETSTQNSGPGSCSYTITRTWKATDACGNSSTCNQLITVQDITPPLITCPADVVRNCQDDLSPSGTGSATATDNCDSSPVITSTEINSQDSDPDACGHYNYTITRTWKATDACGNTSTCDQLITVQDLSSPLITCPANMTKNCQDDLSPLGTGNATASDNCDSSPTITSTDVNTQDSDPEVCGHYSYTITRTWKATDACGNTSTCNQVITVQDITSPLITCPANVTKNCQDDLSPSGTGTATAIDNCDSSPAISSTEVSTQNPDAEVCGHYSYTITRTWRATDACGNTSICNQIITVQDVTSPVITCPANVTKNCEDDDSPSGTGSATATDNCDSSPVITSTDVSTQNSDPELCGHYSYTITRTWKATDACGNTSTCNQVITVQDITSPAITCPADVTKNCQDDLNPSGTGSATATDNCDSSPAITSTDVTTQNSDPEVCGHYSYTITRTWKATDACGNTSTCNQVIIVQDVTSPIITCPANVTKNCQDDLSPSGTGIATAIDNCDSSPAITSTEVSTQNADPEVCGHYSYTITRTWKATDACGNTSTCNQVITVQDVTSPIITCPANVTKNCQDDLSPSGTGIATAIDNCDSSPAITSTEISTQNPDAEVCGHYTYTITRTWKATDACGNTSTCNQVISVQDITSPLITCPANVTKNCQDDLSPSGTGSATATDNCDVSPAITSTDVNTQNSDPEVCGHYSYTITRTWKATDACGNTSTCNQVITVQDVTAPAITCPADVTKNCQDDLNPSGTGSATATDNCDSSPAISSTDVSSQNSDPEVCGHYSYTITRTWKATDACGNSSTCNQVISVQDVTSPLITCPANVTKNCQDDLSPSGTGIATAIDNCDSSPAITSTEVSTQNADPEVCGHYSYTITRTWKATDACGNTSTCNQVITVQDVTSPIITCPANVTENCQDDLSPSGTGSATAIDNCDSSPAITSTEVSTQNPDAEVCGHYTYTITRTWKATDACGNTSTCNQVISVQDIASPLITCTANVTKNCQDDLSPSGTGSATATDNCDSSPAITSTDVSTQNSDPELCGHYSYTITRTWKATDACGNTSTCNQVITVQDITSPIITCPANVTKNCQDDLSPSGTGSATATDNCDSSPAITSTDVSTQNADAEVCGHYSYTITRTWKAIDACGNTSTCNQVITVQDVTAPLITCPANVTKNCQDDLSPSGTGLATAIDNCDSSPSIISAEISTQNPDAEVCGHYSYTITRTWRATDACGNTSTCNQVITVQDITSPLITCPPNVTKNCQDDLSPPATGMATSTDICDSSPIITSTDVSTQNPIGEVCGHYSYTITRTWKSTDACGNTSTCNQVITVQDITVPLISCPVDITINYPASTLPANTGLATSTDICDQTPAVSYVDALPTSACPLENRILRTWIASDACGNSSTCQQSILIEDRGSICGSVYNDLGQAMAGVEIRLEADLNNNQVFDAGDTLVATAYSAVGTGQFCFMQIRPCNYVLVEIQPATYGNLNDYDTSPDADGDDSGDGPDNQIPVTVSPIENDMDNNFVDIICPTQLPVIPADTICANGNVVFQTTNLNLGALTYTWSFGSGSSPSTGLGLGPISVNYVTTTNNQANGAVVSMTISKAGCPDLSGQVSQVEINPFPNASINASTASLCYFDNRTFQPTAPVIPGATYQWNFGAGAVPATATGYGPHSVYYPTIGSKTVKLVIHPNEPGAQCPDSSTISFTVITCLTSLTGTVKSVSGVGIGSVTINLYVDSDFNGIKDDDVIVASGNTVAAGPTAGAYSLTSLTPGNYVIIEEQPSSWISVGDGDVSPDGDIVPNIDQLDNIIPVTLHPSITDLGNNFTEQIAPGTITGSVFVDLDNDDFPDGGEGLPNVIISIYRDSIANGHADNLVPVATQVTDPTGFYSFSNIPVGNYLIAETQPVGYDSQIDIDASNDDDLIMNTDMDDDTIPVTILAGELDDQNYFIEGVHCNLLVTNTLDSGDGSLRAAIECAQDGDIIQFDASLSGMTINITSTRILIDKEIIISSSLTPRVTIASQIPGLFEIQNDVIVEFHQLDIVSGVVISGNMGASFENRGILKFNNISVFRNPLLPSGEYLIRNTPNSNLVLSGSCYFEMD